MCLSSDKINQKHGSNVKQQCSISYQLVKSYKYKQSKTIITGYLSNLYCEKVWLAERASICENRFEYESLKLNITEFKYYMVTLRNENLKAFMTTKNNIQ